MKTDSLFYRLFQEWPELVSELAGLEASAAGYTLARRGNQAGRLDFGWLGRWPLDYPESELSST